jgi:APA family basic amino acid/polyamine antiporter
MPPFPKKRLKKVKRVQKQPIQHISIFEGILFGIGCGFGASIFLLLGEWIVVANTWIFLSLILAAIIIFLSALNYSELMVSLHVEGGVYNIGKEGVGGTFAFINGFFLWITNIMVSTFSAEILNQTIIKVVPFLKDYNLILIIFLVSTIGLLSFYAKRFSTNLLIVFTVILLIIFGIFVTIVLFTASSLEGIYVDPHPTHFFSINILGTFQAFIFLLILFKGIMLNLAQVNLDLDNINKNIPRVNLLSVIISAVIYIIIFLAVFLKIDRFSEEFLLTTDNLMAAILSQSIGIYGYFLMYTALVISTIITINASLGSATGVFKALVRDG